MTEKRDYEIVVLSKGAFARTVRVFSPKKADRAILMHDGQNAFRDGDAAYYMSWRALDALKKKRHKKHGDYRYRQRAEHALRRLPVISRRRGI